ncbi:N-acetyltransferase [uncultured Muribaculum sp.]|jgi:predicted N-acetyltransferase YhbS|uniref:GNAT family N-acetyltransferase n=1 Tax=uncultured Muribaculum sp. TaxID=1918613 RepID=UPI0025B1DA25|nr:N-acetyltransferase [uncultured Muribaculum sp.]
MNKSAHNNFHFSIRQECESEFSEIRSVVELAFLSAGHSDGDEHNLVDRIRKTNEYIPELALVAVCEGKVIGHIMLSKIMVGNSEAVALAPLSVHPDFQKIGVGKLLIESAHGRARELGYKCCVVLGSPEYYSKSGYVEALKFNIYAPFDVPDKYYMVFPFVESDIPAGFVGYSGAFGI